MTTICTICARGGSKGVPRKNVREMFGKPLIVWSIEQARASGLFDMIVVSSDSPEILDVATAAGVDLALRRPDELATDTAGKLPAIRHALLGAEERLGRTASCLVDLQPTSPLRLPEDIVGAVTLWKETGADCVITGQESRCSPYYSLVETRPDGSLFVAKALAQPLLRRQDAPRTFDMNGSIYVWNRDRFLADPAIFYPSTRLYEMPQQRSVDIDTEFDFRIAEFILSQNLLR